MDKVIVQFAVAEDTDFDQFIDIEEALIGEFLGDRANEVDGHDIGEGRFNIYVHVSEGWELALTRITAVLVRLGLLSKAIVVKYHGSTEEYEVVQPESYGGKFAL